MKKTIKTAIAVMALVVGILPFCHQVNVMAADVIEGFHGGTGTEADPYQIATAEEFEILRGHLTVDDGFDHTDYLETCFVLIDDIDYSSLSPLTETKFGLSNCRIDGNGHVVSNISSTGNPLFYHLNGTEIKNITFENCNLKNTPLISKEVFDGSFSDITLTGSKIAFSIKSNKDYKASSNYGSELRYGGLINWAYSSKLENITADATMTINGVGKFGMIAGHFQGDAKNCLAKGKVKASLTAYKKDLGTAIGALFGETDGTVKNCVNKAAITVSAPNKDVYCSVAGISGTGSYIADQKIVVKYSSCKNQGNITVKSKWHEDERQSIYVAGIEAGYAMCGFEKCTNSGKIVSNDILYVAGIVNEVFGTVKNCKNTGVIESTDTRNMAGIANTVYSKAVNCKNTATIKTIAKIKHDYYGCGVSGIANSLSSSSGNASITKCVNSGQIICQTPDRGGIATGIVGSMGQSDKYYTTVSNCKNTATITGDWWISGIAGMSGNWQVKTNKNVISSCENIGTIIGSRGDDDKPGILGYNLNTTVKNCLNKGAIKRA